MGYPSPLFPSVVSKTLSVDPRNPSVAFAFLSVTSDGLSVALFLSVVSKTLSIAPGNLSVAFASLSVTSDGLSVAFVSFRHFEDFIRRSGEPFRRFRLFIRHFRWAIRHSKEPIHPSD
ncbi:hypothetical protein [Lysinibacillus sp. NPDC096259]